MFFEVLIPIIVFGFWFLIIPHLIVVSFIREMIYSIPLFLFAREKKYKYSWFAFFPYLRDYLKYTLLDEPFDFLLKGDASTAATSIIIAKITVTYIHIPNLGWLFKIIRTLVNIIGIYRDYRLYKVVDYRNAGLFVFISYFIPEFEPLFLFAKYWELREQRIKGTGNTDEDTEIMPENIDVESVETDENTTAD